MRILFGANRFFGDVKGGGNRVAWDAAKLLTKKGHDVALLCEGIEGKPESERVEGVWLVRYRISRPNFDLLSRHQKAGEKTLRRVLRNWTPDLIWGHMPLQMTALLNTFPSARAVYTLHSPVGEEFLESRLAPSLVSKTKSYFANAIERRCCNSASVISVLSHFSKSELLRLHGEGLASGIRVTSGWTDVAKFTPVADRTAAKVQLGWPTDRIVFFTLRRLVSRMGLDRLVAAAGIVRDQGHRFQLYIGGTGPLRGELETQIQWLHLGEYVSLMGEVPESELSLRYAAADVFVIPTRALECFGLIAVEAMSAGTPVLSTPVGALPEIIERIEPRWLMRDNSPMAIAETMSEFIQGKLPIHAASEIRAFVEANYSEAEALENFVNAAVRESGEDSKKSTQVTTKVNPASTI